MKKDLWMYLYTRTAFTIYKSYECIPNSFGHSKTFCRTCAYVLCMRVYLCIVNVCVCVVVRKAFTRLKSIIRTFHRYFF